MTRYLWILCLAMVVFASSCSEDESEEEQIEKFLKDNNLTAQTTGTGLYVIINSPGQNPFPNSSSNVTVHYHGYLLSGQVFDSSVSRGTPLTISLTQLIPGWREGIPLFGTGGTGTLLMTSKLAYGGQGSGIIPGNTPIAFDIQLISVNN